MQYDSMEARNEEKIEKARQEIEEMLADVSESAQEKVFKTDENFIDE